MVHIKKKKKDRDTWDWKSASTQESEEDLRSNTQWWQERGNTTYGTENIPYSCFPISDWKSHKPLSFRQKRQRQFHTEIVGSMTFWHLSALRMIPAQAKHPKMKIPSQPAVHNYTEFQMSFSLLPFRSKHWTIERQREMIHRYHRK